MRIFIEPNDVLMFRDGKPFAGGDDHFARGSFPPPPSTIYGAIRSHILSLKSGKFQTFKKEPNKISKEITDEIGFPDELGTLKITYFGIAENHVAQVKQYFPMPKDVAKQKGKDNGRFYILKPQGSIQDIILTDMPAGLGHLWVPTEESLESASGFLSEDEMAKYLMGAVPGNVIDSNRVYEIEERTGIRKNRLTRSVETGGLYSVVYFRMNNNFGFALEVTGTQLLPDLGILRLGGDHRSANYCKHSWNDIDNKPVKNKVSQDKHFKLVLLTPAVFEQGWIPDGINIDTREGLINNVKVKIIASCIGKPIGIGGFDIVKGIPKVMNKAVPAGSVYYFELLDQDIEKLFSNLWLKSINNKRQQEGFGITLIGGI